MRSVLFVVLLSLVSIPCWAVSGRVYYEVEKDRLTKIEEQKREALERVEKEHQADLTAEKAIQEKLEQYRSEGRWEEYDPALLDWLSRLPSDIYARWLQEFTDHAKEVADELALVPTEDSGFHPHRMVHNSGQDPFHQLQLQNEMEHKILGFLEYALTQGSRYSSKDRKPLLPWKRQKALPP